jgi:hypothetical protein
MICKQRKLRVGMLCGALMLAVPVAAQEAPVAPPPPPSPDNSPAG